MYSKIWVKLSRISGNIPITWQPEDIGSQEPIGVPYVQPIFIFVYVNKNNDSIPHLTLASAATHKNTIFECWKNEEKQQ